jgi:cysteine desulfurase
MARAAELSAQQLASESLRLVRLKTLFLSKLKEISADIEDNAPIDQTHPGILNCYFPGISAEELTVRLDAKGICVSPGAACSARDSEPSHVLRAMGYSPERAGQSLRFSFGRSTTQDEILQTASAIADILHPRKER